MKYLITIGFILISVIAVSQIELATGFKIASPAQMNVDDTLTTLDDTLAAQRRLGQISYILSEEIHYFFNGTQWDVLSSDWSDIPVTQTRSVVHIDTVTGELTSYDATFVIFDSIPDSLFIPGVPATLVREAHYAYRDTLQMQIGEDARSIRFDPETGDIEFVGLGNLIYWLTPDGNTLDTLIRFSNSTFNPGPLLMAGGRVQTNLILGKGNLQNYSVDFTTDDFRNNNIFGYSNFNNIDKSNDVAILGTESIKSSITDSLSLRNILSLGNYNLYQMENGTDDEIINIDSSIFIGMYNGSALIDSTNRVALIGTGLMDTYDEAYFTDNGDELKDYMVIGMRRPDYIGSTFDMEGTIQISNSVDSINHSWIKFVTDSLYWNDQSISAGSLGAWSSNDTTVYQASKDVVIGGSLTDSTEVLTVYGDIYVSGAILGPNIHSPLLNDVKFGKNIEVTDSSSIFTSLIAGETIAVGDPLYTYSDGELYISDADADTSAKVHYIALSTGTNGNPIDVVIAGSFLEEDTWSWTVGGYIYLSASAGLTQTAPTTVNHWVCELGWAIASDKIFFLPTTKVKL